MEKELTIIFKDGRREEGTLVSPFEPYKNEIDVISRNDGNRYVFSLSEICCVAMMSKPTWHDACGGEERTEEVELITGDRFQVHPAAHQEFHNGYYCVPGDDVTTFKSFFFTIHGIKARRQLRLVGEILKDEGLITNTDLKEALSQQKNLRDRRIGEIISEVNRLPRETIEKAIKDNVTNKKAPQNARVGDILVAAGLVTREQVEEALQHQSAGKKKKIGTLLIERGLITEDQLLLALATKFRMRFLSASDMTPSQKALQVLSRGMANRLQVLPLEINGRTIVVATSEPTDSAIGDSLRFMTNCNIELVVAPSKLIAAAIDRFYNETEDSVDALIDEMHEEQVTVVEQTEDAAVIEPDSKVVRFIDWVLIDAYRKGASDIHFEPGLDNSPFVIRYRIDGQCFIAHQISTTYRRSIVSRLKIIANLDIAERRRPQSGKILLRFENTKLEYRMEITPTVGGQEDAVLRVLSTSSPLPLDKMGFAQHDLIRFREILGKPHGIILCVGPTGSGKTTTLHSALAAINTPERKIWTAEDPVEIIQPGLRQVQVNSKIGFTFSEALRSFLRADPDVIMIGEMRDPETAKTAIEASLTGHLVFSTLHTNSAPETVVRLIEMGIDQYNFADALQGVLAQRLVRKFCDHCKVPYTPSVSEYQHLVGLYGAKWFTAHGLPQYHDGLKFMARGGCEQCEGVGYKGRVALHELLVVTDSLKETIKTMVSVEKLREMALEEGMRTLKMAGIQRIFNGITDLEQVGAVSI
ncbi:MAG: ATPase, T2SS/T4P/T4SS family [Geobacteraceae bacterium]